MENENINKAEIEAIIKDSVMELIQKMGIECEVEMKEIIEEEQINLVCNIKTSESSYLIGQYGVNLQALQHIARVIVRKKTENKNVFILDVNSYRQEKNESVFVLAKSMAEKALFEKRAIALSPMSPYERRLVHMELSKNEQVKTESIGEGEDRRIVIKPIGLS